MKALRGNERHTGMALVVLATVLFSTKGIIVKLAYQYPVAPMQLLVIRMLMAMPFYLLVLGLQWQKGHGRHVTAGNLLLTVMFGISGYYIASYFDLMGLVYLPASLERLVLYSYPSMVLLLAVVFLGQRLGRPLLACLVLVYVGLVALFVEDALAVGEASAGQLYGALLVLIAAFAFAVYFIGSELMLRSLPSRLFTAMAMLSATLVIMLHYQLHYSWRSLLQLDWPVYGHTALIAFFCTVLPSFMLAAGIARIGAASGSVIGSAGPVVTLILAFVLLDETLTLLQMAGFVLVVIGVFLLGRLQQHAV